MTLRSVVDFDINDASIDQAIAKLQRLQEAARNVPKVEGLGGLGGGGGATRQRDQSALVQTMQRVGLSTERAEHSAALMEKSWRAIREHAGRISTFITDIVRQLTSFTSMLGLATGAATLGGMFGMDAIGRMASGIRSQSLALSPGADVGMMRSFGITNRRLGVGGETLQAVSNLMQSPSGRGILQGIVGANVTEEMDPTEATLESLRALRERSQSFRAQGMPIQSIMQATQANQLGMTPESLMRLMNMPTREFNEQQTLTRNRAQSLNLTDNQLRNWQNFLDTIDTAKGRIEKTFIEGLGSLAEPVGRLANALTDMLQSLLQSDRIREWIENLRMAIEGATAWLRDPTHRQDIDAFFARIGNVVEHLGRFASALSGLVDWIAEHFRGIVIGAGALEGAKYGALAGGALGSVVPGVGTAVGAGVGGLVGAVAGGAGAAYLTSGSGIEPHPPPSRAQQSAFFQQQYEQLYRIAALRNLPYPEVAAQLGAAQSTLETGGGAHVIGQNYYGIKARQGEEGISAQTTEMVGGQSVQTTAAFRPVAGPQEYLDFMARQFPGALRASNIDDAISASQGYATDLRYRDKLHGILRGQGMEPAEDVAGPRVRQQVSALGNAWRDQNRQVAMANTSRPVSPRGSNLPGDGSNAGRLGNVLITLRNEAGGNAFISAGAIAT